MLKTVIVTRISILLKVNIQMYFKINWAEQLEH